MLAVRMGREGTGVRCGYGGALAIGRAWKCSGRDASRRRREATARVGIGRSPFLSFFSYLFRLGFPGASLSIQGK